MDLDNKNSILVIGATGSGKSSLINHLVGKEVAKVGAVGSVTYEPQRIDLNEYIEIIDTRGLFEVSADMETWEKVEENLLVFRPELVILCVDGSRRDNLDSQFMKVESILQSVFEKSRLEPDLAIIANKMDLLDPIGAENLPQTWPCLESEKGRNIDKKISILYDLSKRIFNVKLTIIQPTCLEWYENAEPWNIEKIRNLIFENYSFNPSESIKDLSIEKHIFEEILGIQEEAIRLDSGADKDIPSAEMKRKWFFTYINKINFEPKHVSEVGPLSEAGVKRITCLQNTLIFLPYLPGFLNEEEQSRIKSKPKDFVEFLIRAHKAWGINEEDCKDFMRCYSEIGKEILNQSLWKKVLAVFALAVLGGIVFWWAAPWIGGLIGTYILGLHGAAAVSAGLAWLGLGSLAAGGFGMFGGTMVVVGAGSVLAAGTSHLALSSLANNLCPETALMDCAKTLQVFDEMMKELKDGKASEKDVLQFTRQFAAATCLLERKGESERMIKEKDRSEAYEEGLKLYRRTLFLIDERRKMHQINFVREKMNSAGGK